MIDTKFKLVWYYIDSRDRTQGETHWFNYSFHNIPAYCDSVALSSISLPKAWYLINDYNDRFVIEVDNGFGVFIELIVILTKGEYRISQLVQEIINKINAGLGAIFLIDVNDARPIIWMARPLIVFYNANVEFRLRFDLLTKNNNIATLLGFNNVLYESIPGSPGATIPGIGYYIKAPNIFNLTLSDKVFIECDFIDEGWNHTSSNVLQNLNFTNVIFANAYVQYYQISHDTIKSIKNGYWDVLIKLTDEYNNIVNMNGVDWNMTLHFFKLKKD